MDNYTLSALCLAAVTNSLDYDVLRKDADLVADCVGLNTNAINDLVIAKYL